MRLDELRRELRERANRRSEALKTVPAEVTTIVTGLSDPEEAARIAADVKKGKPLILPPDARVLDIKCKKVEKSVTIKKDEIFMVGDVSIKEEAK